MKIRTFLLKHYNLTLVIVAILDAVLITSISILVVKVF
jgi:hypothetical protein